MTSYGKGDVDWIGGTCKRHVREKTYACLVSQNILVSSVNFAPTLMQCIVLKKRSNLRKRG